MKIKLDIRDSKKHSGSACATHEQGAALVEFAIVAPLLLLFSIGLIHFGLALVQSISITSVAREVSQYAANVPMTEGNSGAGHAQVRGIAQLLIAHQNFGLDGPATVGTRMRLSSSSVTLPENSVEVVVSGRTKTFFQSFTNVDFRLEHTGPYLMARGALNGSLSGFLNPPEFVDCNGDPIPGCTDRNSPCVVQTCP